MLREGGLKVPAALETGAHGSEGKGGGFGIRGVNARDRSFCLVKGWVAACSEQERGVNPRGGLHDAGSVPGVCEGVMWAL